MLWNAGSIWSLKLHNSCKPESYIFSPADLLSNWTHQFTSGDEILPSLQTTWSCNMECMHESVFSFRAHQYRLCCVTSLWSHHSPVPETSVARGPQQRRLQWCCKSCRGLRKLSVPAHYGALRVLETDIVGCHIPWRGSCSCCLHKQWALCSVRASLKGPDDSLHAEVKNTQMLVWQIGIRMYMCKLTLKSSNSSGIFLLELSNESDD